MLDYLVVEDLFGNDSFNGNDRFVNECQCAQIYFAALNNFILDPRGETYVGKKDRKGRG